MPHSQTAQAPALGAREISDAVFEKLSALIEEEAGIILQQSKRLMIGSRVYKRIKALGFQTFEEYCTFIESEDGTGEHRELIGVLTTNVTAFFRENHHFEDFETVVLPDLIARAKSGERVRIWSAGCSIGAEPYSIAMTMLKAWRGFSEADVKILATDIDPVSLHTAKRGIYPRELVEKEVPSRFKAFFSNADDGMSEVSSVVKSLVSVRALNLVQPWPMSGTFSTVFCRNVVIYFGAETTEQIWSQFAERLESGGRLYIGHSERVKGPAEALFQPAGVTAYARTEG